MITLYHGSNVEIEKIRLDLGKPGKDFGKGFYLNPNYAQAYKMAVRAKRILRSGEEIVSAFEFDEKNLEDSSIKVKIFSDYSEEWAEFIVANRKNTTTLPIHDYDIVIGPIADDDVGFQLNRFIEGIIPLDVLVRELKYNGDHVIQYFFATEKAVKLLKRIK